MNGTIHALTISMYIVKTLISNVVKLFPNEEIKVVGEPVHFHFDSSQIEQVLINLIKNSVEANEAFAETYGEKKAAILVKMNEHPNKVILQIIDAGEGVQNLENLFTPFYTTKKKGSGVGLVLCQQIIEAHQGYLLISNREDQHGCVATIELPL